MQWEADFLLFLQNHVRNDFLDVIMNGLSTMMNGGVFVIILIALLLVNKKTRRIGVVALIALLACFVINNLILKNVIARTRPYDAIEGLVLIAKKPNDYSFPSGHTAISFVVAGAITWCLPKSKKWMGVLLLVLSGLIAFSRLYVGAHYPTDVIFGILSGIIISIIVYLIVWKRINKNEQIEQEKGGITDEKMV